MESLSSARRYNNSHVSHSCQLCEDQANPDGYCLACNLLVCEKCREIHSNIPSCVDHIIISIKILYMELQLENFLKKMPCLKHPIQNYTVFCETCGILICMNCKTTKHNLHKTVSIRKFIEDKVPHFDSLHEYEEQSFEDDLDMIPDCPTDKDNKWIILEDFPVVELKVIHTVTTQLRTLDHMIPVSEDTAWIADKDNNISKINLNKPFFSKWSQHSAAKKICQIEGFQPLDMTINRDGSILFVSRFQSSIKLVQMNSQRQVQVRDICNFPDLQPVSIHCEKSGEQHIWIGLAEDTGLDSELSENSTRQLAEVTQKGDICHRYEFNKDGKRLFTFPWRITNTSRGICIIDRTNQQTGQVISLDRTGQPMWIYKDTHPSFSRKPFFPVDMVVTSSGKIIVADKANTSLHILNEKGHLISQPFLVNLGIEKLWSVNIDQFNHLWIGCQSDKNSKKAQLYEIEMSGL